MEPAWEWHVGDPIGTGSDVGAPEVPYMSYGPKRKSEDEKTSERYDSNSMAEDAWKLYQKGEYYEALNLIDQVIDNHSRISRYWNIRAIILDAMERYDEAIEDFNIAFELGPHEKYEQNKGISFMNYAEYSDENADTDKAFIMITRAIRILENVHDEKHLAHAWEIKGNLHEKNNSYLKAFNAYKKAAMYAKDDPHMKRVYEIYRDNLINRINIRELKCPKCDYPLKITDNYCFKCGAPVEMNDDYEFKSEKVIDNGPLGAYVLEFDED